MILLCQKEPLDKSQRKKLFCLRDLSLDTTNLSTSTTMTTLAPTPPGPPPPPPLAGSSSSTATTHRLADFQWQHSLRSFKGESQESGGRPLPLFDSTASTNPNFGNGGQYDTWGGRPNGPTASEQSTALPKMQDQTLVENNITNNVMTLPSLTAGRPYVRPFVGLDNSTTSFSYNRQPVGLAEVHSIRQGENCLLRQMHQDTFDIR